MKALTISQPFASMIADGSKWVENRTWPTAFRGPLAIHAGKGGQYLSQEALQRYPTGCIVAVARLTACLPLAEIERMSRACGLELVDGSGKTWFELAGHMHVEGPWCFVLEDVRKLPNPVQWRGSQRFFEVPEGRLQ